MKRLAILFFSILCLTTQGKAQTFTQHIQQKIQGKGSVTVTQSKEIDDLVNGSATVSKVNQTVSNTQRTQTAPQQKTQQPVTKKNQQDSGRVGQQKRNNQSEVTAADRNKALEKEQEKLKEEERQRIAAEKAVEEKKRAEAQRQVEAQRQAEAKRQAEAQRQAEAEKEAEEEMNIPTVDMRKKVMRNARKVTGYRVQAFAGGNTRADKNRAQRIGEAIKMKFPDQPIYVHFYSPRWICRVGNYRSYGEASRMLKQVRAMGYKGATIVKGKITVFE